MKTSQTAALLIGIAALSGCRADPPKDSSLGPNTHASDLRTSSLMVDLRNTSFSSSLRDPNRCPDKLSITADHNIIVHTPSREEVVSSFINATFTVAADTCLKLNDKLDDKEQANQLQAAIDLANKLKDNDLNPKDTPHSVLLAVVALNHAEEHNKFIREHGEDSSKPMPETIKVLKVLQEMGAEHLAKSIRRSALNGLGINQDMRANASADSNTIGSSVNGLPPIGGK